MNLTKLSMLMAIPPWGFIAFMNLPLGIAGLVVQVFGVLLMFNIGAAGKWGKV